MSDLMLRIDNVSKRYRLGQIGGTTLRDELQRWAARRRGKEDPTKRIGAREHAPGETFLALDGVSFDVARGERVGIIGHNGAGKSTLLKLISRVTAPTSGTIGLNGRVASMLEVGTGFHGELTGRENIYMNGAILGMTRREIDAKMEDIIEFSECRQFIDTPVKRYSSGMYVKLAFSVAAHLDSEIMIMDEVLAVGDMAFQQKCLDKMRDVSMSYDRTILYVSHNMNTIRQLCNRCIVLNRGKLIFNGDVEDAISLYQGDVKDNDFPTSYDFSDTPRDYHFGKEVFIRGITFPEKSCAFFTRGECMRFIVHFDSSIEVFGAQFLLIFADQHRMKSYFSIMTTPVDITSSRNQCKEFEFDTTILTEDVYTFKIEVLKRDTAGNHYAYDNVSTLITVKVLENSSDDIVWIKRYWGNIRLPDMPCIELHL